MSMEVAKQCVKKERSIEQCMIKQFGYGQVSGEFLCLTTVLNY